MDHIKLIKTEQDHEQAVARLLSLMDRDPAEGTKEFDEIDVLALLIEQYEKEHFPIDRPDPISAIKFRMDQDGLKNKDMARYFGSASKVTEVLNGTRPLSLQMIRRLSEGLGISADILIQTPEQKDASKKDIDWSLFPLVEMRKRGYFDGFTGTVAEVKDYAGELVNKFLSSVPGGHDLQPAMLRTSAHLRSNDKRTDTVALWAWQVRILQKAAAEQLQANYVKGTVTHEWMREVVKLSWSDQGPSLAKEFLNKNGIHLVVETHFPKTYLDGAVCFASNGNPVIALTLRHDRVDNFWFTLMHELAHIALHYDGNEVWFIDDLDARSEDHKEDEADQLASSALLPGDAWTNGDISDAKSVRRLAASLNISPCIIAGMVRHDEADYRKFGKSFRDKIRNKINWD